MILRHREVSIFLFDCTLLLIYFIVIRETFSLSLYTCITYYVYVLKIPVNTYNALQLNVLVQMNDWNTKVCIKTDVKLKRTFCNWFAFIFVSRKISSRKRIRLFKRPRIYHRWTTSMSGTFNRLLPQNSDCQARPESISIAKLHTSSSFMIFPNHSRMTRCFRLSHQLPSSLRKYSNNKISFFIASA